MIDVYRLGVHGYYRDRLRGPRGQVLHDSGWRGNRIVDSCHRLVAALMKGDGALSGILFLALGEGLPEWDSAAPSPLLSAEQLAKEWYREAIPSDQIQYVDDNGQPSATPTNRLQLAVTFDGSAIVTGGQQSLREFGLFGGDAGTSPNSGFLLNYVIHPRIDLTPRATLIRELHLHFGTTSA